MRNHHLRSEDGAIAATATVMMVALLGIAMLAIDGGQLFTSRRNVLTDTDAAALAAAREMIGEDCDLAARAAAEAVATDVLVDNDAETTTPTAPAVSCVDRMGRATVTAVRNTDLAFGGLAGIPDVDVQATSVAQYGPLSSGTGLRPLAVCDRDPHFLEFAFDGGYVDEADIKSLGGQALWDEVVAISADAAAHLVTGPDGVNYPATSEVHRVLFSRYSTKDPTVELGCGGSSGNWGWLDFTGKSGTADIKEWIEFGYDKPISVGPVDEDCVPEDDSETDCIGQTGAHGKAAKNELAAIRCPSALTAAECAARGLAFPVIVFDSVTGNGANARYDHVAFLGLILRDWEPMTGSMKDPGWFGFEFVEEFITSGTISGTPSAIGPGLVGVQLCGGGYAVTVDDYCVVP